MMNKRTELLSRRRFLKIAGISASTLFLRRIPGVSAYYEKERPEAHTYVDLREESYDPVLRQYIPNSRAALGGRPNLHHTELSVTPLKEARSILGHTIESVRDPHQDLDLALFALMREAENAGSSPIARPELAHEIMDILLGETAGRPYDGFALLNFNRGAITAEHVADEYKMKAMQDTGETFVSSLDGETRKIWEVTVNMFWYRQNYESDTYLLRMPFDMHPHDEFRINWRIYSLITEDLAPTTILNDGFARIFHGLDSTFTSIPSGVLAEISVKYPPSLYFRGLYNWGWGAHPPRVQFLQPVWEVNENGDLHPFGESFAVRNRDSLTFASISEAAPEMKIFRIAEAALAGTSGTEIEEMLMLPDVGPAGTFREWTQLCDDQRQLPPEAWAILAEEDGLEEGDMGDYDIVVVYLNHEAYGTSKYAQYGAEGKGGVMKNWKQGESVRVKVINLDNDTHYYRNVDFSARFTDQMEKTFGNGRFSFDKMSPKPTYGVPKVAEMQWRTGWGYVPHLGVKQQSGLFPRKIDRTHNTPFLDQFGDEQMGYVFKGVSGYWRFDPPAPIRAGKGLGAGTPLREMDGSDGVLMGLDTEGFGVAKMPLGELTTHPDRENFPSLTHPGFLKNPGEGGDIIPPTPIWYPFLVLHPETGTLKDPQGNWWVDQTYFHGRPVPANSSIVATIEAPRASGQLFYQFDPLFHDNSVFSLHPRADIVR